MHRFFWNPGCKHFVLPEVCTVFEHRLEELVLLQGHRHWNISGIACKLTTRFMIDQRQQSLRLFGNAWVRRYLTLLVEILNKMMDGLSGGILRGLYLVCNFCSYLLHKYLGRIFVILLFDQLLYRLILIHRVFLKKSDLFLLILKFHASHSN